MVAWVCWRVKHYYCVVLRSNDEGGTFEWSCARRTRFWKSRNRYVSVLAIAGEAALKPGAYTSEYKGDGFGACYDQCGLGLCPRGDELWE